MKQFYGYLIARNFIFESNFLLLAYSNPPFIAMFENLLVQNMAMLYRQTKPINDNYYENTIHTRTSP
ncbi:hypothetical protein SAMN06295967_10477 [Belliella buryatensis]|uniref:Uncharacterized protein n=1 Tax=Belliella buryatensis TaxID=1500549 RepID=A0A239C6G1_9BACT|nr:hypothetical protein SAMN06295967_10477 [Belliella buryatensis]